MKQEIINYERTLLCRDLQVETHAHRPLPRLQRYGPWQLDHTLERLGGKNGFTLNWIGNDENSHVFAFFYALLLACLSEQVNSSQLFLQLKHSLYHQSKEALDLKQQRTFVEHLSLAQHSKDIGQFLKKSNHLEIILLKIYEFRIHRNSSAGSSLCNSDWMESGGKMAELHRYSSVFPFLSFELLSEKCGKIVINGQIYYILSEKDCFFVGEKKNGLMITRANISTVSSVKRLKKSQMTLKKANSRKNNSNFNSGTHLLSEPAENAANNRPGFDCTHQPEQARAEFKKANKCAKDPSIQSTKREEIKRVSSHNIFARTETIEKAILKQKQSIPNNSGASLGKSKRSNSINNSHSIKILLTKQKQALSKSKKSDYDKYLCEINNNSCRTKENLSMEASDCGLLPIISQVQSQVCQDYNGDGKSKLIFARNEYMPITFLSDPSKSRPAFLSKDRPTRLGSHCPSFLENKQAFKTFTPTSQPNRQIFYSEQPRHENPRLSNSPNENIYLS